MSEPRWLVGGDAVLAVAADAPTVWLVSIDDPMARARAEAVAISSGELAAVAHRADAGERLLRRRLAKLLLASANGGHADAVAIERGALGAPVVATPAGWRLSVAARWPACAIGVAPYPLGVDIERIKDMTLPPDLLTEAERQQIPFHPLVTPASRRGPATLSAVDSGTPGQARGDEERRLAASCWAAKEAHAKWTGRPRDLDPAAIETGLPPLVTSRFGTTRCWLHERPDYVAAVCTA